MSVDEGMRKRRRRYTNVPAEAIEDYDNLDCRALGLLVRMLSKPDGWTFSAKRLANAWPKDGETTIATGLRQLAEAGYYRVERRRLKSGKVVMGNAVSEEPVESWQDDYRAFGGKPVSLIQQPDGSFQVKRPDGTMVGDGFDLEPPRPPENDASPQVTPERGFPGPVEPGPGEPGPGDAGPGEPPPLVITEGATTESEPHTPSGCEAARDAREAAHHENEQGTLDGEPATSGSVKPKGRRTRAVPWPGRYDPTPDQLAWAAKHYPSVNTTAETAAFNAYYDDPERPQRRSRGDWPARWQTWIKKADEFGPSRRDARPTELELRRAQKITSGWWARFDGRPVLSGTREDLDALVVKAFRAGATDQDVTRALVRCNEPVPSKFRFEKALLGQPLNGGAPTQPGNLGPDLGYDPNDPVHAERRRYFG